MLVLWWLKNGYDLKCYQLENYEDISKKKSVLKCIYQKYDIEFFKNVIIQHKYNKFYCFVKTNEKLTFFMPEWF